MSKLPLSGVRMVDFCWVGAGSYATKLLADLGADVVKIESTRSLDSLRLAAPFKDGIRGVNRSGYFADRNTSKRSVCVNMKEPRGVEMVRALIAKADVVANNFRPGTMEKLGVGYEAVRAINPGAIFIGMSMNGDEGPDRMMLGYGITMAALTGFMGLSGFADRAPSGTGTNYPDHIPNPAHAAFAILAALRHKRRTGQGQKIDLAQTEPMLALMPMPVIDYQLTGRIATRQGNDHAFYAPHGVYRVAGDDRWIAISVTSDAAWQALVEMFDAPNLQNPAWATNEARLTHRAAIDAAIGAVTYLWDGHALMEDLQRRGVMAGVVQNVADLIDNDPQVRHRDHWRTLSHAEMGPSLYNGAPFRFASGPVGPRWAAPLLGEHTQEVFVEALGIPADEIEQLVAQGVLI